MALGCGDGRRGALGKLETSEKSNSKMCNFYVFYFDRSTETMLSAGDIRQKGSTNLLYCIYLMNSIPSVLNRKKTYLNHAMAWNIDEETGDKWREIATSTCIQKVT